MGGMEKRRSKMPLRKQKGNMYPWVTHMHTHLGGECPHGCGYCYVQTNPRGVSPRYKGRIRLIKDELDVDYSKRWWDEKDKAWKTKKVIFLEHMNDMFAMGVRPDSIHAILEHTRKFPDNEYVLQTKDPNRAWLYLLKFPQKFMMGTTIETNRDYENTRAPMPRDRYLGIRLFEKYKTFVTIEPIMDFDLNVLLEWLVDLQPDFINIGADSKRCSLPEPPPEKIANLIKELGKSTNIKIKSNLKRLLPEFGRRI